MGWIETFLRNISHLNWEGQRFHPILNILDNFAFLQFIYFYIQKKGGEVCFYLAQNNK